MTIPSKDQCAALIDTGATLTGNADISGPGVIIAFIASAYITFTIILLAYISGMTEAPMLNKVDTHIFRIRPYRGKHPHVHAAIRKAVLSLSDQQIVTGIAIMGAGFQGLRTGTIAVYHYQIVLYLAWMSSSVHLCALALLRPFLMDHVGVKTWRLCGMLVLMALLFVGLVPTISNSWGVISAHYDEPLPGRTGWAIPAICFWGTTVGDGVNSDAVLGWLILAVSYIWKVGDLFQGAREFYMKYGPVAFGRAVERVLVFAAERYERTRRKRWLWMFRVVLIVFLPITSLSEIAGSFTASLWVALLGLVFGTFQIAIPRLQNQQYTGEKESEWGFGQLTPLILLIQPVGAVTEVLWVRNRRESVATLEETDWNWTSSDRPATSLSQHKSEPFVQFTLTLAQARKNEMAGHAGSEAKHIAQSQHEEELETYLYSSRLFQAHIICTNIGIALIAAAVFTFDAWSIGVNKPRSWFYVGVMGSVYIGSAVFLTIFFIPFSKLGRSVPKTDDEERMK